MGNARRRCRGKGFHQRHTAGGFDSSSQKQESGDSRDSAAGSKLSENLGQLARYLGEHGSRLAQAAFYCRIEAEEAATLLEVTELSEINDFCRDAECPVKIASIPVVLGSRRPQQGADDYCKQKK